MNERFPVPPVFNPVPDGVETEGKAPAEQTATNADDTLGGLWVRDDPDNASVDDTVRDHLGHPVQDWQRRPVPWEYTSKAKYKRDLQKFMDEVYGDDNY